MVTRLRSSVSSSDKTVLMESEGTVKGPRINSTRLVGSYPRTPMTVGTEGSLGRCNGGNPPTS